MIALAALFAAGLLAGPAASSAGAPDGASGPVSVQARVITRDSAGRLHLDGDVVVRRGTVVLRARSATLDQESGEVDARGDVLLTDAGRVISADGIHALLTGAFQAEDVTAFVKDGAVELGAARSLEEARRTGRNRVSMTGRSLRGEPGGRLTLHDARVTLCDCGGGAPSWEIRSREADVIPGERAILSWPVLYVTPRFLFIDHPVPVLPIPWLYLPLGERHTGLLLPLFTRSSNTGFGVAEPLFITLGRSADLTVTPSYLFGRKQSGKDPRVRGPGAELELRFAPAEGSAGRLALSYVHDLDRELGGAAGDRILLLGEHQQPLGREGRLRLDLGLSSDPVWWRDFNTDLLQRSSFYRRSDLLAGRAFDAAVVELNAAYLQPLTPNTWGPVVALGPPKQQVLRELPRLRYGALGGDVPTLHRLPSVAATLLPERLGPLTLSGRVGAARFATVDGADVGQVGPGDPGATTHTLTVGGAPVTYLAATGRDAVTRGDARLELAAPVLIGDAVALRPFVRGAVLGYLFDTPRDPLAVGWGVAGATLSTELTRDFGALRHRVTPAVELRAGSAAWGRSGALDLPAYDLWDRVPGLGPTTDALGAVVASPYRATAAPPGAFRQLRVSIDNHLGRGDQDRYRLLVGQDLDLARGRLAETFLAASGRAGPFSADVATRMLAFEGRPEAAPKALHPVAFLDKLTEFRAGVSLADDRGDMVRATLFSIAPGGSGSLQAGVDALFDLKPIPSDAISQGTLGGRVAWSGATLAYDALFPGRMVSDNGCNGRRLEGWQIQQHSATLTWDSPCRCFRAVVNLQLNACNQLSRFGATIDLSQLGERALIR